MLGVLVYKELLSQLLSLRFSIATCLQVGALLASFVVMAGEHHAAIEQYRENVKAAHHANEYGQETVDHFDYEHEHTRGVFLATPPHPLSWLISGLSAAVPMQIHISAESQRLVDKGLYRNPVKERMPAPDLLFMTRMLLSLLAVLYAFDAICGEREDGTLRQVLAGPVPRHLVLLGKWIGGMATLAIGFVLGSLVGLIYLVVAGVPVLAAEPLMTLVLVSAVSLLYMAVFHTLGLWMSVQCRHATTAVVVSLLAWALVTLVLPGLLVEVARVVAPSPARTEVIAETHEIVKETRVATWAAQRELKDDPVARQSRVDELAQRRDDRIAGLEADYQRRVLAQAQSVERLERLLPAGILTQALTALTGSGTHYVEDVRSAQTRARQAYGTDSQVVEVSTVDVLRPDLTKRLAAALPDIALLAGLLVLMFVATHVAFLRYDVR